MEIEWFELLSVFKRAEKLERSCTTMCYNEQPSSINCELHRAVKFTSVSDRGTEIYAYACVERKAWALNIENNYMNVMYDVKRNGQSSNDRTVTVSYRQDRTSVENRSVTVNGIISDGYEVPISLYDARNAGSNDGQATYGTLDLAFEKLKEATYWEPGITETQLYSQIQQYQFPQIERQTINSRKYIASGEFGTVEKAIWQSAQSENRVVVAVKALKSETDDDRVRFLREAAILGQFHHPNVVALYGVVTLGSPLLIVLEYLENGDLKQYLTKQRADICSSSPSLECLGKRLLKMCREIASGLEYLSAKLFVHRDLAARNILLDHENTCKIGDFGLARDVAEETYYFTRGGKIPIRWSAPETWNFCKYSSASDVWSYGILLYEIWSLGCRPYGCTPNSEVMSLTDEGYRLPPPPGCSRSMYRLMIDCWNGDSHDRPSCSDVVGRLSVEDDQLLVNRENEESITGKLGDSPQLSANSYQDLQMTHLHIIDEQQV
ncbi:ephrin type-A receptor 4a-like [Corticium candelabrum]|uniref:ephrin type-A receptor 4a-like n=1 Tax=Corticium candelabrum TaxID=121492 RepID=UPI002E258F05|nr:ephrin type-A receptor 4a-like [Corticium candelabrum]